MKKLNRFKIFSNKYVKYSLIMILGMFIGWLFFHPSQKTEKKQDHSTEVATRDDMDMLNAPTDKNGTAR